MKLINIKNIKWRNPNPDLPTHGRLVVEDDFKMDEFPIKLEKRHNGYINEITYSHFHIPDTVEELLVAVNPNDKRKDIMTSGKLSAYGKRCVDKLETTILDINAELKKSGSLTTDFHNKVYMGYENITGHTLGGKSMKELMKPIKSALKS